MSRLLMGLFLASAAGGAADAVTDDRALIVFVTAMVAIGVWFRGGEVCLALAWRALRAISDRSS